MQKTLIINNRASGKVVQEHRNVDDKTLIELFTPTIRRKVRETISSDGDTNKPAFFSQEDLHQEYLETLFRVFYSYDAKRNIAFENMLTTALVRRKARLLNHWVYQRTHALSFCDIAPVSKKFNREGKVVYKNALGSPIDNPCTIILNGGRCAKEKCELYCKYKAEGKIELTQPRPEYSLNSKIHSDSGLEMIDNLHKEYTIDSSNEPYTKTVQSILYHLLTLGYSFIEIEGMVLRKYGRKSHIRDLQTGLCHRLSKHRVTISGETVHYRSHDGSVDFRRSINDVEMITSLQINPRVDQIVEDLRQSIKAESTRSIKEDLLVLKELSKLYHIKGGLISKLERFIASNRIDIKYLNSEYLKLISCST